MKSNAEHNNEIRAIISHALLGSDEIITRETFDLCVSEVVKYVELQVKECFKETDEDYINRKIEQAKDTWKDIDEEEYLNMVSGRDEKI